jgi:hypothetical protein
VTDRRETTDQLDLFGQPAEPVGADASPEHAPEWIRPPAPRTQMTELAGETWEDAFGDAA